MKTNESQSAKLLALNKFTPQHKIQLKQPSFNLKCLHDQQLNYDTLSPSPRANSQFIYHKNKLYIYGGFKVHCQQGMSAAFYSYDLQTKLWNSYLPKAFFHELESFSPKCSTILNNKWFLFGSQENKSWPQNHKSGQLWKLNFQLMDWMKVQQNGEIPRHLQSGCLVGYEKNILIYYGGYSQKQNKCNNSIYLYNVDSKTWHQCIGSYTKTVKSRFAAAMVNINNRIFLYGGYYKQAQSLQVLKDFYQITFKLPSKGFHAQAYFRLISTILSPSPRAQHQLFACENNIIYLFGGKNDKDSFQTQLWSFHLITGQWKQISKIADKIIARQGSNYIQGGNQIYIFGGIERLQDEEEIMRADLWSFSVNLLRIYSSSEELEKIQSCIAANYNNSCKLCYELRRGFFPCLSQISAQIIDGAVSLMSFPFPAFGLLVDNSLSLGANIVDISIQGEQPDHYICIQDNAKLLLTQEDLISCLLGFESSNNLIMSGCDKKIKKQIQKQNHRKQYGFNLKLGCFTLGKKFLLISNQGQTVSVFLCFKDKLQQKQSNQQNKSSLGKQVYAFHFYSFNAISKQLISPLMQSSRLFIQSHYKRHIKTATISKSIKNTLYIFQTFLDQPKHSVTLNYETSDIYYGDIKKINKLASYGFIMDDCIDVSLRAYLSLLYLKSEHIKINLGINQSISVVVPQGYLQKIDKACRTGQIIDLEDIVEIEFKMFEAYWQHQLRKNNHFFSNGLLLYSKNRLISRYKIQIGGLLPLMAKQVTCLSTYLPLFGYAQLPDNIPVNIFKTNFSFSILLQKLFCRLKFVEQGFTKRYMMLVKTGKISIQNYDRRQKLVDQSGVKPKKRNKKRQSSAKEKTGQNKLLQDSNKSDYHSNVAFFIRKNRQVCNEEQVKVQQVYEEDAEIYFDAVQSKQVKK